MQIIYLSKSTLFFILSFLSLSILIDLPSLIILSFFIAFFSCLLFRKKRSFPLIEKVDEEKIFFSPVTGTITKIKDNQISITVSPWNEYGIFLPFQSEIINVQYSNYSNKKISLNRKETPQSVLLELQNKKNVRVNIHFFKFSYSLLPQLLVLPGDRGKRQANIGYFPFGGLVNIKFKNENKIIVKEGQRVASNKTIMASFTK